MFTFAFSVLMVFDAKVQISLACLQYFVFFSSSLAMVSDPDVYGQISDPTLYLFAPKPSIYQMKVRQAEVQHSTGACGSLSLAKKWRI